MAAQRFLTTAEVLAWLLKPEHDRGNTAMTEPPLWKRGNLILNMAAGKGLLDPQLTHDGAVSRCTGSDKGSVYQLSVGLAGEEEVACSCTCPFASGPNSPVPTGACKHTAALLLWRVKQLGAPAATATAATTAAPAMRSTEAPVFQDEPGGEKRKRRRFAGLTSVLEAAAAGVAPPAAPAAKRPRAAAPALPAAPPAAPAARAHAGTAIAKPATMPPPPRPAPARVPPPSEDEPLRWLETAPDAALLAEARRVVAQSSAQAAPRRATAPPHAAAAAPAPAAPPCTAAAAAAGPSQGARGMPPAAGPYQAPAVSQPAPAPASQPVSQPASQPVSQPVSSMFLESGAFNPMSLFSSQPLAPPPPPQAAPLQPALPLPPLPTEQHFVAPPSQAPSQPSAAPGKRVVSLEEFLAGL